MQSKLLHDALSDFAEEAASALQAQLEAGAEMPFELRAQAGRAGGQRASLQLYRPMTGRFLIEHERMLESLAGHRRAVAALEAFSGLDRYLACANPQAGLRPATRSKLARQALKAFAEDVFGEQSDLALRQGRLQEALSRLDAADCAQPAVVTLLASLQGLAILSEQLPISQRLTLARPQAVSGLPEHLLGQPGADEDEGHILVVLELPEPEGRVDRALTEADAQLRDLLRALRLYGDGRIALSPLAFACSGAGPFSPVALRFGGSSHGRLVVRPEQEDELRAFCNLISKRPPATDALAWALRRYELGCERSGELEGLSDHLLALQALLEPERVAAGLLASRTAALCSAPDERKHTAARVLRAVELERDVVRGEARLRAASLELAREIAGHVRALLRDVLCGHLPSELQVLADELASAGEEQTTRVRRARREPAVQESAVQDALPI